MSDPKIYFIVLFGCPGVGKTTLLKELRKHRGDRFRFLTLDEPTRGEEVSALLARMYNETKEEIAAGRSVAAAVQTLIMETRAASYKELLASSHWTKVAHDAQLFGYDTVVVCDGHLLTDDKLYVRSKFDGGQISTEQLAIYEERKNALLAAMDPLCSSPRIYCHLTIDADESGTKHHHRVCTLRQDEAERGAPPSVFARLARYADDTAEELARDASRKVHRLNSDGRSPMEVCDDFVAMLAREIDAN